MWPQAFAAVGNKIDIAGRTGRSRPSFIQRELRRQSEPCLAKTGFGIVKRNAPIALTRFAQSGDVEARADRAGQ